jgi:hypothetical protein
MKFAVGQEGTARGAKKKVMKIPDKYKHSKNLKKNNEAMDVYLNSQLGYKMYPLVT